LAIRIQILSSPPPPNFKPSRKAAGWGPGQTNKWNFANAFWSEKAKSVPLLPQRG